MSDQPQGPVDPPREETQPAPPPQTPQTPLTPPPAPPEPAQQPGYGQPNPYGSPPAYGQPPAAYGQPATPYGEPSTYGQPNPYAQPPAYTQQQPAYGEPNQYGYAQAPAYAGGRPMHPGSIGFVEASFGEVADFGKRAVAYLLDVAITLIGLIPMVIGGILIALGAPDVTTDQFGRTTTYGGDAGLVVSGSLLIALGGLVSFGIWLWNRIFRMGRTGQSVGKKAIGLKLIDDKTGQPIGAGMAFLREVVLGVVNQVFYLAYLWMLWDPDKQTLGDKAVHSTVVIVPKG